MSDLPLVTDAAFEGIDYSVAPLPAGEYDACTFTNCGFHNADLSGWVFRDCTFRSCDLSLARLRDASFQDVVFADCKLMGLHFNVCNKLLLTVRFERCVLKHSTFHKLALKKTSFVNCNLQDADFTDTDLTLAVFDRCDLLNAQFARTNLKQADLRSSYNYIIDPEQNVVKQARFSLSGVVGLLGKYDVVIE